MKNQWLTFYTGSVVVKISGKGLERYINHLTRNGLSIWNVRRQGVQSITFKIKLHDVSKLRRYMRGSGCRVEFIQREGIPFFIKRLYKNMGLVVGLFLFLTAILVLSNMIWGIEIKGAEPATEHKIRKELDKMGVKTGRFQWSVDTPEGIQRHLTDRIEEITWVGVELNGTTYHLQVVEKNEPEPPEYMSPQHLVAKKKAVIVDMFIEEGQKVVDIHDTVTEGQLLVSGLIGKEGEAIEVPAKGKVWGETWYKTDVELPIKSNFEVYNGNEKRKYSIKAGDFSIPIWGFGKIEYQDYDTEDDEKTVQFLKWKLPLSFISSTIREKELETRVYSRDEAFETAMEMAREDIRSRLDDEAEIKGEKILHRSIDNGKVKLSVHFQIIENIAQGQPIIQGESE